MQEIQVGSQGQEDPLEKGNGYSLQYSCLENSMDRGAWWAAVHRVTKSRIYAWICEQNQEAMSKSKDPVLFFLPHQFPRPELEPLPPALEAQSLNH